MAGSHSRLRAPTGPAASSPLTLPPPPGSRRFVKHSSARAPARTPGHKPLPAAHGTRDPHLGKGATRGELVPTRPQAPATGSFRVCVVRRECCRQEQRWRAVTWERKPKERASGDATAAAGAGTAVDWDRRWGWGGDKEKARTKYKNAELSTKMQT